MTINFLMQRIIQIFLQKKQFTRSGKHPTETYIYVFLQKSEFQNISRKFHINRAFWHYLNVDITDQNDESDFFWRSIFVFCLRINQDTEKSNT